MWAEISDSLVLVLNWAILKVVLGTRLCEPVWKKVFISRVHLLNWGITTWLSPVPSKNGCSPWIGLQNRATCSAKACAISRHAFDKSIRVDQIHLALTPHEFWLINHQFQQPIFFRMDAEFSLSPKNQRPCNPNINRGPASAICTLFLRSGRHPSWTSPNNPKRKGQINP